MQNTRHIPWKWLLAIGIFTLHISSIWASSSVQQTNQHFEYFALQQNPYVWDFNGQSYADPGYYTDMHINGQDSTIGQLLLSVDYEQKIEVCEGTTVDSITTPWGTFGFDDCDCLTGCLRQTLDSMCVIEAKLCRQYKTCACDTVRDTLDVTLPYDTLRANGYMWFGVRRDTAGVYRDTLRGATVGGCDSIGLLILRTLYDDSMQVCGADTAIFVTPWGGYGVPRTCECMEGWLRKTADDEGLVYATLCVKRNEALTGDTTAYICAGDLPYIWHNKESQDGDTIKLHTIHGCDSVVTLRLYVSPEPKRESQDSTICLGDVIEWHGKTITADGEYLDTARVTMGDGTQCDSIWYNLIVKTQKADTVPEYKSICYGQSYSWKRDGKQDSIVSTSGIYMDTVRFAATGCDSAIYILDLTVDAINRDSAGATTCAGVPYTWRGQSLLGAGIYRDTAQAATTAECDTVYVLNLSVLPASTGDTTAYVCDGSAFYWHGQLAQDGDQWTTVSRYGCDSVVTLHIIDVESPLLEVRPDTIITEGASVLLWANGADYYRWNPAELVDRPDAQSTTTTPSMTTQYTVTGYRISGSNMIVNGDFEQGNTGFNTTYNYYAPRSTNTTEYGKYTIGQWASDMWPTYANATRPDFPGYNNSHYMVIDGSDHPNAVLWNETVSVQPNTTYALSAMVVSLLASYKNGQYALLQFFINGQQVGPIFHSPDVLHQWLQYYGIWNSENSTTANIEIINQNTNAMGNDFGIDNISFVPLNEDCSSEKEVMIYIYKKSVEQQATCVSDLPYEWHDQLLTESKTYIDTIRSASGYRDSICTLNLTILQADTTDNSATICTGSSYTWKRAGKPDRIITEAGNYADTVRYMATGCDSMIYRLTVTVDAINRDSTGATTCAGVPYTWRGQSLLGAGIYRDTAQAQTAVECDTVYILNLRVLPNSAGDTTAYVCYDDLPFYWHGRVAQDGAKWTTTNQYGCDSVVTLRLSVSSMPQLYTKEMKIHSGETISWHGHTISSEGRYYDTLRLTMGNGMQCDSIHYELNVSLSESCRKIYAHINVPDICADIANLDIHVDIDSGEVETYKIHFINAAGNTMPFRDTIISPLRPHYSEDEVVLSVPVPYDAQDRTRYPRPDDYGVCVTMYNSCGDSLPLVSTYQVHYPSWILDQHWDDVIALLNDQYNGGYTFSRVEWLRDGEVLAGERELYIYLPHQLWTNNSEHYHLYAYQALLTRADDGKSILSCPMYPEHKDSTNVMTEPYVFVSPTLVPKENPIVHVQTNTEGTYWLYDPTGKLLHTADYEPCEHNVFDIELNYPVQTMYILVFTPRNETRPLQEKYRVVKLLLE